MLFQSSRGGERDVRMKAREDTNTHTHSYIAAWNLYKLHTVSCLLPTLPLKHRQTSTRLCRQGFLSRQKMMGVTCSCRGSQQPASSLPQQPPPGKPSVSLASFVRSRCGNWKTRRSKRLLGAWLSPRTATNTGLCVKRCAELALISNHSH